MQKANFVFGFMASMLIFALITLWLVLFLDEPPEIPVHATLIKSSATDKIVCPGEKQEFEVFVEIKKPSIIQIASSVTTAEDGFTVAGSQTNSLPYPHQKPKSFFQVVTWTVPNVPPGNYFRVTGFINLNSDTQPEFVTIPFTVGECKGE